MASPYETMALRPAKIVDNDGIGQPRAGEFAAVRVGGNIDGHQVVGALAEGGMGAVFKARVRDGQGEVALKAPLPGGRGGTYYHRMRRFLREARLTARMQHDGVAKVREQGHADGLPYFTLDVIDGLPLSERLYNEGVLPVGEATGLVAQIARAAHHIHQQGVVHRDLKPANILIRPDGTPVIIDFGLARDAWGIDPRITESGIWLGTPAYIAPEQASGEASRVDARADVYSMGAILYELLTGMPPYGVGRPRTIFKALRERDPRPVSQLRKEIPEALERICMRALARDKNARYANAEELANALANFLLDYPGDGDVEEPVESSGLQISDDLESDASMVATGWNEHSDGFSAAFEEDAPSKIELVPISEEQPTSRREMTAVRRSRRRRRRSAGTHRARSSATHRARPKAAAPVAARIRRNDDGLEAFGRFMAFCGPAAAAVVGLLLLL